MHPTQEQFIAFVQSLDEAQLAAFMEAALRSRRDDFTNPDDGSRNPAIFVLAKASAFRIGRDAWEERPAVSLVALPSPSVAHVDWEPYLTQDGECPTCGALVASVAKVAVCPLCGNSDVGCT